MSAANRLLRKVATAIEGHALKSVFAIGGDINLEEEHLVIIRWDGPNSK
jgi:hypothetical protein